MNPARRPRSAVERLATPLIAVALCLSMAAEARAAYADSDIWYNSANGKLSGYTLTALEWWETIPGQFYSEGCECWVQYVDSVRVDGALFDPDNQIHLAVPPYYHPYEAVVVLDQWSPPRIGNWTAWGNHVLVRDYYVSYQWVHRDLFGLGQTTRSANAACLVPVGEVTLPHDWVPSPVFETAYQFRGRLVPGNQAVNFAGMKVTENQPSSGTDSCFHPDMPAEMRYGLSGGTWTVDSSNEWGFDSIGWLPAAVQYIRQFRADRNLPMPCAATVPQAMKLAAETCPSVPTYKTHTVGVELGTSTITVHRDNVSRTRTWPAVQTVALLSHATLLYVSAESGGGSHMVANRGLVGPWERFELIQVFPGLDVYGIRVHNGQFVAAEGGGGGAVNANRPQLGAWEEFLMETLGGGQVAFRTVQTGHYLRVDVPSGIVDATAPSRGQWETFDLVQP